MIVVDDSFDHPLKLEERAAAPLAGGIMNYGYQCGLVWGAALATGAQVYRLYGASSQAEVKAIRAAQRIVESFRAQNTDSRCFGLTGIDLRDPEQQSRLLWSGQAIRCFRMAARYPPVARSEINTVLSERQSKVPSSPVSCAAVLARKMGASDMHRVMAAGLAGGIGLSGGACGALGAAIWIIGMNSAKERAGKVDFNNPRAFEAIDRFLKCTDYEFECSEIIGRRFENFDDHASYLRDGGCSEIIEALAAK